MTPFLYLFLSFVSWDYLWFADLGQWAVPNRVMLFFVGSATMAFDVAMLPTIWRKK